MIKISTFKLKITAFALMRCQFGSSVKREAKKSSVTRLIIILTNSIGALLMIDELVVVFQHFNIVFFSLLDTTRCAMQFTLIALSFALIHTPVKHPTILFTSFYATNQFKHTHTTANAVVYSVHGKQMEKHQKYTIHWRSRSYEGQSLVNSRRELLRLFQSAFVLLDIFIVFNIESFTIIEWLFLTCGSE